MECPDWQGSVTVGPAFFFDGELAHYSEATESSPLNLELDEKAAHHARVIRLNEGDGVQALNGRGWVVQGVISRLSKKALELSVVRAEYHPQPGGITLFVPVGDRDRMLWLAEKATELGIKAWQPVVWHRSKSVSPRGEGAAFREKVRARMIAALIQSRRFWIPDIHPELNLSEIPLLLQSGARFLMDINGDSFFTVASGTGGLNPDNGIGLAFGPEGGVMPEEKQSLVASGFVTVSLGDAILRFETAGVAGISILQAFMENPANREIQ